MFLDGLEIPGDAPKVATFHRNGGNFGPEWVATFKRNGGSFAPDYAFRCKLVIKYLAVYEQCEDTTTEDFGHRGEVTDGNEEECTILIKTPF